MFDFYTHFYYGLWIHWMEVGFIFILTNGITLLPGEGLIYIEVWKNSIKAETWTHNLGIWFRRTTNGAYG